MSRQFPIPEPYSPEATVLAQHLAKQVRQYGDGPALGVGPLNDILALMAGLADGPRYEAEHLHGHPAYDNEVYVVRDRLTGAEMDRYTGYFAGQDARKAARTRNSREG